MRHHPKALWWLTCSYSLFMAAFGTLVASIVLYQTNQLKMGSDEAYGIFAAAMALLWLLPLAGGYLSTKFGYSNGGRVGILFTCLGFIALCFPPKIFFFVGLSLFVVGNAFATPAIWCLVDHCYSKDSLLRESGFTLFYLVFNLGAVIGILTGGYIADAFGFCYEFMLDALCLFGAFLFLHFGKNQISPHAGRSTAPQVFLSKKMIFFILSAICIASTPFVILLLRNITVNNVLTVILLFVMTFIFLRTGFKQKNRTNRNKMFAFVFLSLISIVFWTLYSLEPSLLSVFIQSNVDRSLLGFEVPAVSFFAFDGVFVILFGIFFSRFWVYLSQKKKNPSLPFKFASSLFIIGLGFCLLSLVIHFMGNGYTSAWYIVFAYMFFAIAELFVSPLGIAMVGSLAPEGEEGLMMGFWQLCCGVGGIVAGYIAIVPHIPARHVSLAISNPIYSETFFYVGFGAILAAGIVLIFVKKLKKLMKESS